MKYSFLSLTAFSAVIMVSACSNNEDVPSSEDTPAEVSVSVPTETPVAPSENVVVEASALVNPNEASQSQLETLTAVAGVNSDLVSALIETRPFENAQAFDTFLAQYMGDEAREIVYSKLFIPMNLNTTPEADFMIIPGVGKKMAHEFEEYRPYNDMAQFDKEISKYVDAKELARLRQYVTLD